MDMMRKTIIIVAICGLALTAGVALAIARTSHSSNSSRDLAVTRTYLSTRDALERATEAALPTSDKVAEAYVAGLVASCPDALKGAPLEGTSRQRTPSEASNGVLGTLTLGNGHLLVLEMINGLERTVVQSRTRAINAFSSAARGLAWSSGHITNVVHSLASMEEAQAASSAPDVCRDIKRWVATGYRTLPTGVESEGHYEKLWRGLSEELRLLGCQSRYPGRAVLQLLKAYQRTNEGATSDTLERREAHVIASEDAILHKAIGQAEHVLGLPSTRNDSQPAKSMYGPTPHDALSTQACRSEPTR